MDLNQKLNQVFTGRVVRKDLVHQVKRAANVPSFVLEFLLSKYCASDDPDEIAAGTRAVLAVIENNYIRPDESNKAQSLVHQRGRHKFIDKIHVKYVERESRHWAAMENFNSTRLAINERFYTENEKLLEGGIWAEVTVAHNTVEEDKYAFYVEDLRPIQLSKFNEQQFLAGRAAFTRDEWIDVILRSVGLEPNAFGGDGADAGTGSGAAGLRVKLHLLARLIPLVQSNYNFIELGPRGTGKSYFYSEFSPYSTLLSGGQASTATLLYNNARRKVGAVGFWDNIAFDEVGNMRIKDPDTIQIMKDYMANGRFSRGQEVIATASFAFVGNIDLAVEQLVASYEHDLFVTLPKAFDLAVQDRFFCYLPGWEIPKMDHRYFTSEFGLITDYLAEAFHYLFKHNAEYFALVQQRLRLGADVQGRDELAIRKTVSGLLKIIHPDGAPTDAEFEDLVAYAVEGRRRVKEQMNKRKPDDEFSRINLSYFTSDGQEVVVHCPESRGVAATQNPRRQVADQAGTASLFETAGAQAAETSQPVTPTELAYPTAPSPPLLTARKFQIRYGDKGYGFDTVFGPYLRGAREVHLADPNLYRDDQLNYLLRFCETVAAIGDCEQLVVTTRADALAGPRQQISAFAEMSEGLREMGLTASLAFTDSLPHCELQLSNGWHFRITPGLQYFQEVPARSFQLGAVDLNLRACLEALIEVTAVPAPV